MYLRVDHRAGRLHKRQRQAVGNAAQDAWHRLEAWLHLEQGRRQYTGQSGRVDAVVESGGGRTTYAYDHNGDLMEIVEANGQHRRYSYDGQRRLTQTCHPDGTTTTYIYGDNDRLVEVNDRGIVTRYHYASLGRVTQIRQGKTGAVLYHYDETGRVAMARTPRVATTYAYDAQGRMVVIEQSIDGVTLSLRLAYDHHGRLEMMLLPGSHCPLRYAWDHRGRPVTVSLGDRHIASFSHEDNVTRAVLGNGVAVKTTSNKADGRLASQVVTRADQTLFEQHLTYNTVGEIVSDGAYRYAYDTLGRLAGAEETSTGLRLRYAYDSMDNRVALAIHHEATSETHPCVVSVSNHDRPFPQARGEHATIAYTYRYDSNSRLTSADADAGNSIRLGYDRHGRLTQKTVSGQSWAYWYDDTGQLTQVMHQGQTIGRFTYDHKGRLVLAEYQGRSERYLYGPSDELLAVTDAHGNPIRLLVRTPLGLLAEVHGALESGEVLYLHSDARGATRLGTNEGGEVVANVSFDPFGLPTSLPSPPPDCGDEERWTNPRPPQRGEEVQAFQPHFGRHVWHSRVGLYYCGARWYDPTLGRFITPDTFTGSPDDARIVTPITPSSRQAMTRAQLLGSWLKQPRLRNSYVFCSNDPIGRFDPDGHWSFGGALLTILGTLWTLPNTLIGLFIEITCLVGEVIRWLVWLVTFGHVSWQTPGFDAAASGRLNAFAMVCEGGWFGSLPLLGMTFGNVFLVSDDWRENPVTGGPGDVFPEAYQGRVAMPRNEALYEHALRHTNQYGWFGPIYLFVHLIDWMVSGFTSCDMWLERDARRFAGL
jgi:RHS repeat-associated protein